MKIKLSNIETNRVFEKMKEEFRIYGPVRTPFKGTMSDTDSIRYEEVSKIEDIEFKEKSQFSAKEVILPITKVLYHFSEDDYTEPKVDEKKILLFVRPCDINAVFSLDQIYLNNGPKDNFYKQTRERIYFALIGCPESFRNCFCVSMDANKTDDYSLGFKPVGENLLIEVKDESFASYFDKDMESVDFQMDFVEKNEIKVSLPGDLDNKMIANHDMWREYDSRCVACGKCNFVCPTCSCYAMQDIYYLENENIGERRRVWASCQVDGYTDLAGGHSFRQRNGDKMRFKTMHKAYEFKKRFGQNMCSGCGRCTDACPSYISLSTAINKLTLVSKGGNND